MKTEKLLAEDKKLLRENLRQVFIPVVGMLIIFTPVIYMLIVSLHRFSLLTEIQVDLTFVLILLIVTFIIARKTYKYVVDLRKGIKKTFVAVLKEKQLNSRNIKDEINSKYHPEIDPLLQIPNTKIDEYCLVFDDFKFLIEEIDFHAFSVGDQIKIHLAYLSHRLIRIEKVKTL